MVLVGVAQVVGMTASARVETTLLIRTRLKEQLAEAERHAEVTPQPEILNPKLLLPLYYSRA